MPGSIAANYEKHTKIASLHVKIQTLDLQNTGRMYITPQCSVTCNECHTELYCLLNQINIWNLKLYILCIKLFHLSRFLHYSVAGLVARWP